MNHIGARFLHLSSEWIPAAKNHNTYWRDLEIGASEVFFWVASKSLGSFREKKYVNVGIMEPSFITAEKNVYILGKRALKNKKKNVFKGPSLIIDSQFKTLTTASDKVFLLLEILLNKKENIVLEKVQQEWKERCYLRIRMS